jgi:hypothetical protein
MNSQLLAAFNDSLDALAAGEPLEAILARYPRQAAELRPMLEAARAAREHGPQAAAVPRQAQAASRARMLARAAELRRQRAAARPAGGGLLALARVRTWALAHRAVSIALAFLLGFVLGTYGVVSASAGSLPGEPLYGIKRTLEQTQLLFSPGPRARAELETSFSERRVDEVQRLLAGARSAFVTFGGTLERIDGQRWTVAGIVVETHTGTEFAGTPFPGLFVEISGTAQPGGVIRADRVDVTGVVFYGQLRSRAGDAWLVDDTRFVVSAITEIAGAPGAGDMVTVHARRLASGDLLALRIAAGLESPQPAATATPAVEATATLPPATGAPAGATATNPPAPTPTPPAPSPGANTPRPDEGAEVRFTGVLQAAGAEFWQISGQAVRVTPATDIRDNPQVGDTVRVRAVRAADGSLTATRIDVDDD